MNRFIAALLTTSMTAMLISCGTQGDAAGETEQKNVSSDTKQESVISETETDNETETGTKVLHLNSDSATLDGAALPEYDYTWNYDPSMKEPEYSGTQPDESTCYIAHDIIYYPEVPAEAFSKENYDGEMEWVTHYTNEELADYLFGTLPVLGEDLPTEMMHSKEEAYANPVLHITQPGTYVLEGDWKGQILIDLGDKDDCFADESKKVQLILNGVDVTCDVAPALVFSEVYECDNEWEEREETLTEVDLSEAGARVTLVDGTENNFTGSNVFRLLKPQYKKEGSTVQKKLKKMDGAFYSYVSMLIEGNTGILNVTSTTFEGMGSELHLTIDGGYINVVSQDDGINVNEDHVSIITVQDGRLTIFAGQGAEGDVIDSNGYINVLGGIVAGASPSMSDDMLDSEDGTRVEEDAKIISNTAGIHRQGGFGGFGGGFRDDFGGDFKGAFEAPADGEVPQRPDEMMRPDGQNRPGFMPDGQNR